MKKINVLMILSSFNLSNGIASYVMNYYRNMENVNMDFIVTSDNVKNEYYDEIISRGNKIFFIKSNGYKKIFSSLKNIKEFFEKYSSNYDIVHCNVANIGLFYLYYAKKYGVKTRILHSHATITADKFLHKIRNDIIIPITKLAGIAMFGKEKFFVINNAIDSKKYFYSEKYNEELRNELKIKKNDYVIGNIGRLRNQKNQKFLLDIIYDFKKKNKDFKLVIVGNGTNEYKLKKYAKLLNLTDDVIFLESRNDTYKMYSLFDIFVLPSLYEGFPFVGIEAQTNGVKCLFSDKITKEVNVSGDALFLSIDNKDDCKLWSKELEKNKTVKRKSKIFDNYDIKKNALNMQNKYFELIEENSGEKN
jgi:glycosyltransferase involved in cell wall biosynthesis